MVHIVDDSSEFDAPLDLIWAYLRASGPHAAAHESTARNYSAKSFADGSSILTFEQKLGGKWSVTSGRGYEFAPLGVASENLEGPLAGSKYFEYYTPRGEKTGVTVVGDFVSKEIPSTELEKLVYGLFEQYFEEDTVAIGKFREERKV